MKLQLHITWREISWHYSHHDKHIIREECKSSVYRHFSAKVYPHEGVITHTFPYPHVVLSGAILAIFEQMLPGTCNFCLPCKIFSIRSGKWTRLLYFVNLYCLSNMRPYNSKMQNEYRRMLSNREANMLSDLSYKGYIFFTLVVYAFCNRIAEIKLYGTDYALEMHLKGLPILH